jgi:predicted RND superfamily exporter protein
VTWVFGIMGWLHIPFTLVSVAVAPLMLGVNLADCIYMMSRFYEQRQDGMESRTAAGKAIATIGIGIMLAGICAFFGFGSFALSDLPALAQFGIMSAVGVVLCFLFSVTLLPAAMILRDERLARLGRERVYGMRTYFSSERSPLERLLRGSSRLAQRRSWVVLGVAGLVVAAGLVGTFRLKTTSDLRALIPQGLPSVQSQYREEDLFGGQQEDVVLVTGDVLSPEALDAIDDFRQRLQRGDSPYAGAEVVTLGELIYDATLELRPELFPDPEGRSFAAVMAGYPGGPGAAYEENVVSGFGPQPGLITEDRRSTIISVRSDAAGSTSEIRSKNDVLRRTAEETLAPAGLDPQVGGITPLTADLEGNMVPTLLASSLLALLLSGLFLLLVFRRLGPALATLAVLLLGVAAQMGLFLLLGWELDMLTVLGAAIIIGLGIGFSIHVTNRFLEERQAGRAVGAALEGALNKVGRALIFSAISTAGAFAIITLSEMVIIRRFGAVIALAMLVSLAASVLVLPALLTVMQRRDSKGVPS